MMNFADHIVTRRETELHGALSANERGRAKGARAADQLASLFIDCARSTGQFFGTGRYFRVAIHSGLGRFAFEDTT